jgi:hypothetical protein
VSNLIEHLRSGGLKCRETLRSGTRLQLTVYCPGKPSYLSCSFSSFYSSCSFGPDNLVGFFGVRENGTLKCKTLLKDLVAVLRSRA